MRAWTRFVLVLGLLVAPAFTCEIRVGGDPIQKEYYLSVPFFRQACDLCCAAAAIQMLQGYCQQPLQGQLEILGLIGGSPAGGAWWPQIADGVNRLTCFSGASVSYYGAGDPLQLELAVTEQIGSVVWYSPHRPVLPQAPLNHVGVLVGGSAVESGLKLWWNSVLSPARVAEQKLVQPRRLGTCANCSQGRAAARGPKPVGGVPRLCGVVGRRGLRAAL